MTLANLRGQKEARQHFARHKLLSKTLATVHLKEMRSLANMLWAVGKLQVDLAQERLGPYFAESTEERIRQLVDAAGLPDGRSADQLWYGLVLSRYPWSQELLRVLVQHTVPALGTWDLKAQAQVGGPQAAANTHACAASLDQKPSSTAYAACLPRVRKRLGPCATFVGAPFMTAVSMRRVPTLHLAYCAAWHTSRHESPWSRSHGAISTALVVFRVDARRGVVGRHVVLSVLHMPPYSHSRHMPLAAHAQVLLHISELCPQLPGDDQREQLVAAVEQIVATWSPDEQQPYRCTWPLLGGVHGLGLRISPACKRSLSGLILNTPLNILKEVGARSMSYGLVNLLHLGCTLTPAEASRWEEMLLTAWSSAPRRADERQSHFGLLLSALLEVPNFAPSEELQQQLREVAVDSAGLDMRTARQVLLAAKAWGLVLPPEAARGLQQQATAGRRPLGAKSQPRSRSRKGS